MELGVLHIGLILLFAFVSGVFAYKETHPRENRFLIVPGYTLGGAVIGFFAFYLGIFILWIIGLMLLVGVLKLIFSPKIVIVEKNSENSFRKFEIIDAEEIEDKSSN